MEDIKSLEKIKDFRNSYIKLCAKQELTEREKEYLLGCALILLKIFKENENKKDFFELAYHIILNYAILTNDYEPLWDVAYNYGFSLLSGLLIKGIS